MSQLPTQVDVAIIGAGPAGLTLATLLKKYRPESEVLVIEKKSFPRHKVGESLIIDINRVLVDMEALEAVDAAGFVTKYGSTFVWGDDRSPKTFQWPEWQQAGYHLPYTWHVERPKYDQILADAAEGFGARIAFEHSVVEPIMEGERVEGLVVRDPEGQTHEVRATFSVDCGGFGGPLTRRLAGHKMDSKLRNIATWGYHKNIGWRESLNGTEEKSRALLLSHDTGWIWVLPISHELTSVGFVTSLDAYQEEQVKDPLSWYRSKLKTLPEAEDLFADAEMVDYRQDGKMVHSVQEYSYGCDKLYGPGWVLNGDSSGFVDAILSVGCFMAQHHAQFLAYALNSVLDETCEEDVALASYQATVREALESFRSIAHMLYAYNSSVATWWQACSSELQKSMLVPQGGDPGAFRAFFTGFSARNALYDDAVTSFGGHFLNHFSKELFTAEQLFSDGALDASLDSARETVRGNPILKLSVPVSVESFALPKIGTGRLQPVVRLSIVDAGEGQTPNVGQRMYLPASLAAVVDLMDGERDLGAVADAMCQQQPNVPRDEMRREVVKLAYRLACMGVIERVEVNQVTRLAV